MHSLRKKSQSHHLQEKEIKVLKAGTASIDESIDSNIGIENKDMKSEINIIKIGVCAMERKSKSKPMQEILTRLNARNEFSITIFDENMILNESIEKWPIVDCLIAFHSYGFPLAKCQDYVQLRKPYLINDLKCQEFIKDRYKVYQTLRNQNLLIPKFYMISNSKERIKKYEEEEMDNLWHLDRQYTTKGLQPLERNNRYESMFNAGSIEQLSPLMTQNEEMMLMNSQEVALVKSNSKKDEENDDIADVINYLSKTKDTQTLEKPQQEKDGDKEKEEEIKEEKKRKEKKRERMKRKGKERARQGRESRSKERRKENKSKRKHKTRLEEIRKKKRRNRKERARQSKARERK